MNCDINTISVILPSLYRNGAICRSWGAIDGLYFYPKSDGKASAYNADAIKSGRIVVQQGDVSALTLPEEEYDLATAFETIYFWPGLKECFSQVAKVLKPGGMKCHTIEEIEDALKSAGFSKVKSDHHKSKPWITVIARK